jgi:hypothetical protein
MCLIVKDSDGASASVLTRVVGAQREGRKEEARVGLL